MSKLGYPPASRPKEAKVRLNTRRHLHRAERHERDMRKDERGEDDGFRYRHDAEIRKMLRGVDIGRFETLAG